MRLFIAVDPDEGMRRELIRYMNDLRACGMQGVYTKEENLHLTLAFIGEYPHWQPVMNALEAVSFTPFELELHGYGSFGDLWWAGIKDSEPLTAVVRRIRRALSEYKIPFDRKRFSPHITLIRRANGQMPGIEIQKAAMIVDSISLMRSDRGRHGMIYTEIGSV